MQFRRLFAEDNDFHAQQWVQERDNWLFGRAYYQRANDAVDVAGATLNFMEPVLFYSDRVRAQMFSGDALASDYHLKLEAETNRTTDPNERRQKIAEIDADMLRQIRGRWSVAEADLRAFADRQFAADDGTLYRISEYAEVEPQRQAKLAELEAFSPGLRDKLRDQKYAKLTDEQRSAVRLDPQARNEQQNRLAMEAEQLMFVDDLEFARNVDGAKRDIAIATANSLVKLNDRAFRIERAKKLIEYDYWLLRCELEQQDDTRAADRHFAMGSVAYRVDTDLVAAKREFEAGFKIWRKMLDKHPELMADQTGYAVVDHVTTYRQVLRQLDEPFPEPFILADMLKAHE
ncbi:MAG: hypothetical protein JNM18_11015 [Planctomycetaceae bacterium]|nr:hypothetical protein [Planctomycetaceae bacterium]